MPQRQVSLAFFTAASQRRISGEVIKQASSIDEFLAGPGAAHTYMVQVGAGWVFGRLPRNTDRFLDRLDPLLRWLAVDGFGFHDGFFYTPRCFNGEPAPSCLRGYARRAYDQGLGRCLWFIHDGAAGRIGVNILRVPAARRADLWSGVGLAATHAGESDAAQLATSLDGVGGHHPALAQCAAHHREVLRRRKLL